MTERILEIVSLLGSWGYLVLFLAAFLESSAFLGLLVPGESIVVVAGLLCSQGYLDIGDSIAVISLGAVTGDTVGYALGHIFGRGYFERHGRLFFIKAAHMERADRYFRAHGGKTVFFGRFVGFLRAMAPFAAGISRMPYGRFFAYNISGGVIWAASFTLLGYFFGLSWKTIERWAGRAGIFVFFLLLVFIGFGYLYRELLKRQASIRARFLERYSRIVNSPFAKAFAEKHPGLTAFVTERLSPADYLGLHLTAGLVLSAVFIWLLAAVMEDVITGSPIVMADQWALSAIHHFRTPRVTSVMQAAGHLGGSVEIAAASLLAFLYLLVKRNGGYAAGLLTGVVGGTVLGAALRSIFRRLVKESGGVLPVEATGYGLPSGHALVSVVFYGMIAYFLVREMKSWKRQVLISLAALFLVLVAGFARVYLQYALVTEVLTGYAGGLLWLTVCITGLEVYRKMSLSRG